MFRECELVRRKYDIENNTGLVWVITRIYEDREYNTIIDIETENGDEETVYPEQLVRIY